MNADLIKYNFEYDQKLKVCFIGAGGHSFRNVYTTFQYAPVELVAVCDLNTDRAKEYARMFGSPKHYTDHIEMLEQEKPDAVFIVTSYYPDGHVQAVDLALDALHRGVHVWMEKPTAASVEKVQQLIASSTENNRFVMTGTKKIFAPAMTKAKEIIDSVPFGRPSSLYIKYPQPVPEFEKRSKLNAVTGFLDHIFHPASIIQYLMGKIERIYYEREPHNGGTVATMRFMSGAIGTLHLIAGISGSSPLERVEIVGEGENVVVENGVKLTYYRKAARPAYGRSASYLVDDEMAPLQWEPEFSLGQLYNKNIFYLGYVPEVLHFCDSVITGNALQKGTLNEALEIVKLFEAYCQVPEGQTAIINTLK